MLEQDVLLLIYYDSRKKIIADNFRVSYKIKDNYDF